jgi:Leucine-rich repeat (LRR) protein
MAKIDDELSRALRSIDPPGALAFLDCNLVRLDGLGGLTKYNFLWLNYCPYLTSLEGLQGSGFRRLQISCDGLKDVRGVADLPDLEVLELRACANLSDLSELERLQGLRQLYLEACPQVQDFRAFRGLQRLQTLYVNACTGLKHTDDFSGLLALEELDLSHSENLADVQGLQGLVRLRLVNLAGCTALDEEHLDGLGDKLPDAKIVPHD